MDTERELILHWQQQGRIPQEELPDLLSNYSQPPAPSHWLHFACRLLPSLATLALSAAVIFFFAFNWQAMSVLQKFSLLQGIFLLVFTIYLWAYPKRSLYRALGLIAINLCCGALLALIGQTYQTGADPWELFAVWAMLTLPITLVSLSSVHWIISLGLINLASLLYLTTFQNMPFFWIADESWGFFFVILNSLFLVACLIAEKQPSARPLLPDPLASVAAAILSGISATWLAIWTIFDGADSEHLYALVYLLWFLCLSLHYRYRGFNLIVLTGLAGSAIVVISCLLIRALESFMDSTGLLLVGLAVILLSTGASHWLRKLATNQGSSK